SVGSTGGRDYDRRDAYQGVDFDRIPSEAALLELMQRAVDVMPDLEDAEIVERLAGSRPLSADLRPIIGWVPGRRGVMVASGHTTKGIHLGPMTGKVVSQLICDSGTIPGFAD